MGPVQEVLELPACDTTVTVFHTEVGVGDVLLFGRVHDAVSEKDLREKLLLRGGECLIRSESADYLAEKFL